MHFQVQSSLPKNIRRIESIYGNFSIWQKLKKMMKKSLVFYIHAGYICYVERCKFSTSTHIKYRIVQNIISAICGYFYGLWGPLGCSEITNIAKKILKKSKHMQKIAKLVSILRDIAPKTNQVGDFSHVFTGFQDFFRYINDF